MRSAPETSPPPLGGAGRTALWVAGLAVAALVARAGSPGWQAMRAGLVVAATLGALRIPRRGGRWAALALGLVALGVAVGFLPHLVKRGLGPTGATALLATVAALAGLVAAVRASWRASRWPARISGGVALLVALALVLQVVAVSVAATNVPETTVGATPERLGLSYETVDLMARDGTRLAAWYLRSANGAAVVLCHGAGSTRSAVLDQAAVLVHHGFGVLVVDARGHGASEGRAMDLGWWGEADIRAAVDALSRRPEVNPGRIGVVGLSMGGEEAIGAAAGDRRIRAVVAEGATGRVAADRAWLSKAYGVRGLLQEQIERVQTALTALLTSAPRPGSLRGAVEGATSTRFLLIAAGAVADEPRATAFIAGGAPDRVTTWTVPGAGHTRGLAAAPSEWERRVVGFLEGALSLRSV